MPGNNLLRRSLFHILFSVCEGRNIQAVGRLAPVARGDSRSITLYRSEWVVAIPLGYLNPRFEDGHWLRRYFRTYACGLFMRRHVYITYTAYTRVLRLLPKHLHVLYCLDEGQWTVLNSFPYLKGMVQR